MFVYPDAPIEPGCVLLFVPVELVPLVGGAFKAMEQRRKWATQADFEQGYRAFVELERQLMSTCLQELIQELRDLRGLKPAYTSVPIDERTSDMYRSLEDLNVKFIEIIFALTGGVEHGDHLLEILRGETEASSTRNVLDKLE